MNARSRVSKGSKRLLTPISTGLALAATSSLTTSNALDAGMPMTPPGSMRRVRDLRMSLDDDEDEKMRNRASLDSNASTILGEEDAFEDEYIWTEDQVAIIVRTIEEGNPPSVTEWTPPTTPYVLPFLPVNLIDVWARQLKRSTDWPHSVRAIRSKLRNTAKNVAKSMHTNVFNEQAEDGMRINPDGIRDHADDLIISPTFEVPMGRRDDAAVYRSSLKVQQNDDVLPLSALGYQYQPYNWSRPRSPLKTPRSPSVEPISPVDSYFPSSSPHHSALRNRSRSISPFPTAERRASSRSSGLLDVNSMDHDGTPPPLPPKDAHHLSLSPMKLSPKKADRSAKSPDPADLLALFPPRASHARAPIPMMFTREEMRPAGEQAQNQPQLQVDGFFSAGMDEVSTPNTLSTGGGTPFSSISSISSLLSNGSTNQSIFHQAGLHRQPSLPFDVLGRPSNLMGGIKTHLSEFTERRSSIKRSASFSKPREMIKRAPSYGNFKELPNPREANSVDAGSALRQNALSESTTTIHPNSKRGPHALSGHKRERSDSSVESTATTSAYDTEDVPPSSAPSSGLIEQRSPVKTSPVKSAYETPPKPLPGSPLKAAFDPEKAFTPSPSPTKMLEQMKGVESQSMTKRLLGSPSLPSLLPGRLFRRKSGKKEKKSERGSGRESGRSMSPSPAPSLGIPTSPGFYPTSPGFLTSPSRGDVPASPSSVGVPASPMSSGFPVSPIASRFPDHLGLNNTEAMDVEMEIDHTPTQLPMPRGPDYRLTTPDYRLTTPDSPGYGLAPGGGGSDVGAQRFRKASSQPRVSRKPSFEPRREGEPRRKRVKTDELTTPPRELPDIGSPYETRYAPRRAVSPTAFSEGTPRHMIRSSARIARVRSNVPKTPPNRRVPKSPRLLAGAARKNSTTRTISPVPPITPTFLKPTNPASNAMSISPPNTVSPGNTTTPTNSTITPTQARRPTTFLTSRTSSSSTVMAATAASKAKQASVVIKPTRNAPKREPSFLNAPLLPAARARVEEAQKEKEVKPTDSMRRVGTTRFPTMSTASISSVLFPGGSVPFTSSSHLDGVPESAPAHVSEFQLGALGNGEEGVIRAGESAAQARRAGVKPRGGLRGALSGTRTRMARSISMLGPGERPTPY